MINPKLKQLSNLALVRRHAALQARNDRQDYCGKIIAAGLGSIKLSELRKMPEALLRWPKYFANLDEMADIRAIAEMRYGPGLITLRQLIYRGGAK